MAFCLTSHLQAAPVAGGEYFFGVDPGQGMGTSIAVPAAEGAPSLITVPTSAMASLSSGVHPFSLRWKDAENAWGVAATTWIYKPGAEESTPSTIGGMEYFVDNDPGAGQGIAVALPVGQESQVRAFTISPGSLGAISNGVHTLSVRYQNSPGMWGAPSTTLIVKSGETIESLKIARFEWEWWIGSDFAGRTTGTPIPVSPAMSSSEVPVRLSGAQLTVGQTVTIRAWWVAGDGTVGIPAQRSWTVEAHALAWNKSHFTPAEIGNAAISGPTADPDGDGTSNLLELALGSDPRQSNGVLFGIKELNTPAAGLTIDFPRIAGGSTDAEGTYTAGQYEYCLEELSFVPGGSSVWTAVPRQDLSLLATPQPATPAFEKATATISIPSGMARRFVRLSVKIVP